MTFAAFINSDERDADLRSLSSITMHGDNPYGEPDRKISVFLCLLLVSLNITLTANFTKTPFASSHKILPQPVQTDRQAVLKGTHLWRK